MDGMTNPYELPPELLQAMMQMHQMDPQKQALMRQLQLAQQLRGQASEGPRMLGRVAVGGDIFKGIGDYLRNKKAGELETSANKDLKQIGADTGNTLTKYFGEFARRRRRPELGYIGDEGD